MYLTRTLYPTDMAHGCHYRRVKLSMISHTASHHIPSHDIIPCLGLESVFAVSCALTVGDVGDEDEHEDKCARADGVTLLPVGVKWVALAMECAAAGTGSTRLNLSADEALSEDEVRHKQREREREKRGV
jgi:hypothetical protein